MEDWSKHDIKFRYMMLSRLKMDCNFYLGHGNRNAMQLWACNEKDQIENMKALWNTFDPDDKPEWLTWNELMDYAERMGVEFE